MTYRASADWDLRFTDAEALAAVGDSLPKQPDAPDRGTRARILAALVALSPIHDIGFDDGSGFHLTGWTAGELDVARCDGLMAALEGRATGTIDWSDEEGVHWRDRLTAAGRWEQYPGVVVYPDGEATDPFIVIEGGRVANDPSLPVLDLDPLTRYTAGQAGATELVLSLKATAEACGATDVHRRCDAWLAQSAATEISAGGVVIRSVAARAAALPVASPVSNRGRAACL
jgi:hypothetical protein